MSCHLSLPLFQCSFSFPILMSNALVFIHAGFICVVSCYGMLPSPPFFILLLTLFLYYISSSLLPLFPLILPLSPFFLYFFYCNSISPYIIPWSLFPSQGSVLEATVYGLEPYSQYSLRVEAVNEAGRFIMISSSFKISGIHHISTNH